MNDLAIFGSVATAWLIIIAFWQILKYKTLISTKPQKQDEACSDGLPKEFVDSSLNESEDNN